jgi:hypothetical protein
MKLRKINEQRYCDDETGTYFHFGFDAAPEQATEMIQTDMRIFLSKYPTDDYFGTDRWIVNVGKRPPRIKD